MYVRGIDPVRTRKFRNVQVGNTKVALIVDDLVSVPPWSPAPSGSTAARNSLIRPDSERNTEAEHPLGLGDRFGGAGEVYDGDARLGCMLCAAGALDVVWMKSELALYKQRQHRDRNLLAYVPELSAKPA